MLFIKQTTTGIDVPIQKVQTALYNSLIALWGIPEAKYNCYGRAYKNQKEQGYIPEVYNGGKDYDDPLLNDTKAVTSFFGEGATSKVDLQYSTSSVHLIFCLDVKKVKPAIAHRADEEIHQDVLSILKEMPYGFTVLSLEQWFDTVFREYNGYRLTKGMYARDMHPYHCFRVNLEMRYQNTNC